MRKLFSLAVLAAFGFGLSGCAGLAFVNRRVAGSPGDLYSDTSANEMVTENPIVPGKKGEACATNILGIITTGDASVQTAAQQAGITKVGSVDNKYTNILGLYAKYCVIVTGE